MSQTLTTPKYTTPQGMTLADWLNSRLATRATRKYDWNALKFQADHDPKYRRAQMRYIGTGATNVVSDKNTVPAEHFTFSTMILPVGAEGPLHLHEDAEEVFFVLRGKVRLIAELNGETWSVEASDRDLISWPVGVYRGVQNIGDEEALMCVIVGSTQPETPTYPLDHPLSKIKRVPIKGGWSINACCRDASRANLKWGNSP